MQGRLGAPFGRVWTGEAGGGAGGTGGELRVRLGVSLRVRLGVRLRVRLGVGLGVRGALRGGNTSREAESPTGPADTLASRHALRLSVPRPGG